MRQLQIHAQHSAVNERPKRNDVMKLMTMTLNDVRLPAPHTHSRTHSSTHTHAHSYSVWVNETKRSEANGTNETRRARNTKYETRTTYIRSVTNEYIILNSVGERTKRWMQQLPTDWVYLYLWSCQTATQRQQQQQQQIHTHTHTDAHTFTAHICMCRQRSSHTYIQPDTLYVGNIESVG